MGKYKRTFFLVNSVIWAMVIFILCTLPSDNIPNPPFMIPYMDKIVHAAMFFILAVLLCVGVRYQTELSTRWIITIAMCVCLFYGGIIELLQGKYFNRSADVLDWLADGFGTVLGCGSYPLIKRYVLKRKG